MAGAAVTPDLARAQLHAALTRRNRIVGVLRFALPAAGAIVLAGVLGGIVLDNLREQFGFASIRIDRDNLVVDSPRMTALGDDGTLYSATALMARSPLGSVDLVDMTDAVFSMTSPEGVTFTATAPTAALQTAAQTLTVPGTLGVRSSDGLHGTMDDFFGDMLNSSMVAHGAVDLTFPEGMQVQSDGMTYDGTARVWTFTRATVTIEETPGGAVEETPPVMELAQ